MKKSINIPKFKNKNQEKQFWSKIDLGDYLEAKDFKRVSYPNLKPTTRAISIRLPEYLIDQLKQKANKIDIPYQTLIKQAIHQSLV